MAYAALQTCQYKTQRGAQPCRPILCQKQTIKMADESTKPGDMGNPNDKAAKTTAESKPLQYADYIASLPPPHYATKSPPSYTKEPGMSAPTRQKQSAGASAARVNAVCAPITAAQREEDARRRTWRERWKSWTSRTEREMNSDPDLRPVDRGSRAQLNVWGVTVREAKRKK